jgi:hypothetical protein
MDPTEPREPDPRWLSRAGSRLRAFWVAKLVGIPACMAAFFAVYLLLLNHPRVPVTSIPLIFADRWVPFLPWALPVYASLWLYVSLAPALMDDRLDLLSYLAAAAALSAAGFIVFFAWPTAVPAPDIDWSLHPLLARLKTADAAGNALPSLHVAFAVFTAAWVGRLLRGLGAGTAALLLNWLWCMGIVCSTMVVRQHVALDAISGALLGAAAAIAHAHVLTFLRVRGAIR